MNLIPQISVITVGMNHLKYIKDLYKSLYNNSWGNGVNLEAIYVDNCSTDGSVEFIREHYPQVTIIQNQQALGFGENNNKGVLASHGEYIAIINPDIVLQKGSLSAIYDYAASHKDAGIIVPQLLNPDGSLQYSVRRYITLKKLAARWLTRGRDSSDNKEVSDYLCKDVDYNRTQEIDWAIGAAFFMRRSVYAELGGFDTDYFLYMEDEDMCIRAWKMKRPVVYYPESKMIHNHLRASSKFGKKMLIHACSMMTFFRKHGMSPQR